MKTDFLSLEELDKQLAQDCGELADDPLEWVYYAYPWGTGELAGFDGPDVWQEGYFREWGEEIRARGFDGSQAVEPIRFSTTSGHGVGKSALVAMACGFIMSTRPFAKGIITANTSPQLETKTWAEVAKWHKRCITRHWFKITSGRGAMKMVHRKHPETWRLDAMAWRENMPEAFAGLHAASSTPFYIFDEASGIARVIFETAMGGMTDGEPMMMLFSNPTKPSGFFFDTHHDLKHRFHTLQVDSRDARMTNKEELQRWIEDWGIDSDFCKVRILGEFPLIGDRQFIPTNLVTDAMDPAREPVCGPTDPVIIGVDVARFGDDETTIYVRRGRDGRSIPPKIFNGLPTDQLAHELRAMALDLLPDAINIDGGGVGGPVIDTLKGWGIPNVNEVNFGGTSPDRQYHKMFSYMPGMVRDWLKQQGVTLPIDKILKRQMTIRRYEMIDSKWGTAIKLESKDEMKEDADIKESPDRSDGFGLTFAVPVKVRDIEKTRAAMAGEKFSRVIGVEYERE
jgi:hypothetical protein